MIEEVHGRLLELVPAQTTTTLVHGDFRLDNVIYSPVGEVAQVSFGESQPVPTSRDSDRYELTTYGLTHQDRIDHGEKLTPRV